MTPRAAAALVACVACRADPVAVPPATRPEVVTLAPDQVRAAAIATTLVHSGSVHGQIELPATIRAVAGHEVIVAAAFAGVFLPPPSGHVVLAGEAVNGGQLLGSVAQQLAAPQLITNEVERAAAEAKMRATTEEIATLQRAYDRATWLAEHGIASQASVEQAQAALAKAQADLSAARSAAALYRSAAAPSAADHKHVPVSAPIAGTVLAVAAVPGQWVPEGTALFTIADETTLWVEGALFETDLARVDPQAPGMAVVPGAAQPRSVSPVSIGPAVDPHTLAAIARYALPNPDGAAQIGMSASLVVDTKAERAAIVVPASAIVLTGTATLVFVDLGGGRYEAHEVAPCSTAPSSDLGADDAAICGGLDTRHPVVTRGAMLLWSQLTMPPPGAPGGEQDDD